MSYLRPKDINLFLGKLYHQVKTTLPGKQKSTGKKDPNKNIVLFTASIFGHMIDAVRQFEKESGQKIRIGLLHDSKKKLDAISQTHLHRIDVKLSCDFFSVAALQKTLTPYREQIMAITCRPESGIPDLMKIIPYVPYLPTPTVDSLHWATDKITMREHIQAVDATINPRFAVIKDESKKSIKDIIEKVGFPLIVKPSGLAASRLVSICYHKEELEKVLKRVFKSMHKVHKSSNGTFEPRVLIEQFMEGEMYSIDAYVNSKGKVYFCPMAHVKTGKSIGFDDFFGYQQITPTKLSKESIAQAEMVAGKAIYALGLRSTTVHVELMRLEEGWKLIETGPRMGGFRHMMYEHSYHMNHVANDILIRMDKKPLIPKKVQGYTVAMKFFAKEEGKLKSINGVKKAQELKSFKRIYINKKVGAPCLYAKNGGSSVFNIILFNKDRSKLLADIRRLEKMIMIHVE